MTLEKAGRRVSGLHWIVCLGSERTVINGRVACPALREAAQPETMSAEDCLDCRHLVATPVDRLAQGTCSVGY